MRAMSFWNTEWTVALVNHLWQSTVVVAIACLLSLAFKKNHARVRFWVWFTASIKFLLPFSVLIAAGGWLRSLIPTPTPRPAVASVVEAVTQPFTGEFPGATSSQAAAHHANGLLLMLLVVWTCGVLIVSIRFGSAWWQVYLARRAARFIDLAADVPVMATSVSLEPGIFGIIRPVLLLPDGILERLTLEEMSGVLAHEMCHVRRRDNLTFAVHMVVETLFWFYPLVWWIGVRLIDERERACDEAVVQAGGKAEVYAEGILTVCKFFSESPLACVSGVTGADLKKRIVRIMAEQMTRKLGPGGRLVLALAGTIALTAPLMLGLVRAQTDSQGAAAMAGPALDATTLPKFEVVSIKQVEGDCQSGTAAIPIGDTYHITCMPLNWIIRLSYGINSDDRILGEPDWTKSARYEIAAKVDLSDAAAFNKLNNHDFGLMLQPILQERFQLKVHHVTRDLPVYTLTVAKGGPKLKESAIDQSGKNLPMMHMIRRGEIDCRNCEISAMPMFLSQVVGGTVVDHTELKRHYDFTLDFSPDPTADMNDGRPSIFTALREQLGLQLIYEKAPVDVLVIDQVQRPTPN